MTTKSMKKCINQTSHASTAEKAFSSNGISLLILGRTREKNLSPAFSARDLSDRRYCTIFAFGLFGLLSIFVNFY